MTTRLSSPLCVAGLLENVLDANVPHACVSMVVDMYLGVGVMECLDARIHECIY